jgi:hypothetical protein
VPPTNAESLEAQPPFAERPIKGAFPSLNAFGVAALLFVAAGAALFFFTRDHAHSSVQREPGQTAQVAPSRMSTPSSPPASASVPPTNQPDTPPTATSTPPVIKQFQADPDSVKTGTPAMLIWEVTGADKVSIDHGIGKVSAKGMSAVVPTVSTTYTLTAADSAGATHRIASVTVQPDPDSVPPSVRARQLFTDALTKRQEGQAEEAVALFGRAAELGDSGAMYELGEMYTSGDGVTEDETKAFSWLRRAADAGNLSGMVAVGGMYLLGVNGADPNEEEAALWFQKAADRDSPAALFDLATLYESGRGVAKNFGKAKDLYQRSAKLGNREAQKRLSKLGLPLKNQ